MVSSFSCQKAYKIALGWQGKSVFSRPPRGEELSARKTQLSRTAFTAQSAVAKLLKNPVWSSTADLIPDINTRKGTSVSPLVAQVGSHTNRYS